MAKRVFIVHYWHGTPEGCWYPWLKKELEKKGYEVIIPVMPDTDAPKINKWVAELKKSVGKPDKNTLFIGHSVGCQTIMRYLESMNKNDVKLGGIFFVAPWLTLSPAVTDSEEGPTAKPWLDTKIDFKKTTKTTQNITALFSSNDPYVPKENINLFKELLHAKTILEKNKGHYDDDNHTEKIPVMLKYF
jgi:predicted alpha/beta hydrolase family esterase